jgi:hypothetical protein
VFLLYSILFSMLNVLYIYISTFRSLLLLLFVLSAILWNPMAFCTSTSVISSCIIKGILQNQVRQWSFIRCVFALYLLYVSCRLILNFGRIHLSIIVTLEGCVLCCVCPFLWVLQFIGCWIICNSVINWFLIAKLLVCENFCETENLMLSSSVHEYLLCRLFERRNCRFIRFYRYGGQYTCICTARVMIVNSGSIWVISVGSIDFDLGLYSYVEICMFKWKYDRYVAFSVENMH